MIPDFTSGPASGWSQVKPTVSSVVGHVSKRISSLLMETIRSAGVLRSTGVTPLHHYYDPLRLPAVSSDGYLFPPPVARPNAMEPVAHGRVSQVPRGSFDARCPLSPRVAHPLHVLVASRMVSGFAASGRLTTTTWFNEAETGSRFRITADVFTFSDSDGEVTPAAAESASW